MIQQPSIKLQTLSWQQCLSDIITDPLELLSLLDIDPTTIPWQWDKAFPLRVTRSFAARMNKGDINDPLLRQVLSRLEESDFADNYSQDPLQEKLANPVPGLLHKFQGRVLITFTSSCAIHCRYCFRRHFPYQENNPGRKGWQPLLDYIAEHADIFEVILSGGDPLMATDKTLALFISELETIPHVKLLRFHTRLPVVIPQRICQALLHTLQQTRLQTVMIYHINHPAEINSQISNGVARLKAQHITVLNQSVLLKEVNDSVSCLKMLSLKLFEAGILPYYLHLLDPVQGASHFAVPIEKARMLQEALRNELPGYLVPKFAQEFAQMPSKVPLDLLIE